MEFEGAKSVLIVKKRKKTPDNWVVNGYWNHISSPYAIDI